MQLFRNDSETGDDNSSRSNSEIGELEDNIVDNQMLPPPPPAIQLYPDGNNDQARNQFIIQGPRHVRRDTIISLQIFNGFLRIMVPERITGLAIRNNELFYLVVWENYGNTSYYIQARIMNAFVPSLVIEFHQELVLDLIRNRHQ